MTLTLAERIAAEPSGAIFSANRVYRYLLWRQANVAFTGGVVLFIGANPSTADEKENDPTIRREVGFARRWGYKTMLKANISAYRATDPKDVPKDRDLAAGPDNWYWVREAMACADRIVCAWGTVASMNTERARDWLEQLQPNRILNHLGLTKGGHPKHTLYLRADVEPMRWL